MGHKELTDLAIAAMTDDEKVQELTKQYRMLNHSYVEMMVWRCTERCGVTDRCAQYLLRLLDIENERLIDSYGASWRDD